MLPDCANPDATLTVQNDHSSVVVCCNISKDKQVPALSSNLGRGKPVDQSRETFMALVTFQNSIKVPMPALHSTTVLVSLSSRYRKITICKQAVTLSRCKHRY